MRQLADGRSTRLTAEWYGETKLKKALVKETIGQAAAMLQLGPASSVGKRLGCGSTLRARIYMFPPASCVAKAKARGQVTACVNERVAVRRERSRLAGEAVASETGGKSDASCAVRAIQGNMAVGKAHVAINC